MGNGYFGKVLKVDLSSGNLEEKKVPDEVFKNFLGGYGLGAKLIYDWTKKGYDPLGSDAIIGFVPGLITGTVAPFSGRFMVCGKSPLTGGWGDANAGGYFGPAVKKAGYDGIFVTGIANTPKYLIISDNELTLKDASGLWGMDVVVADKKLQEIHGQGTRAALIGQAGERLSRISGVVNDKGRIAARCGLGAIMGSKKLKAIAISKKGEVPVHDKEALINITKNYNIQLRKSASKVKRMAVDNFSKLAKLFRWAKQGVTNFKLVILEAYKKYGTSSHTVACVEVGDSPIKNWAGIGYLDFPDSRNLAGEKILPYKVRSYGCSACPVQCGAILSAPDLGPDLQETHRPEYETLSMFGSNCLNSDLASIMKINEKCNRAGIDSISTGGAVSFAIECFENGILTSKDTNGIELKWGDGNAILALVDLIVKREGIGDILADGVRRAAEKIGKGSDKFAIHAGGQELAAHDPRISPSLTLSYTTDPTPGRHTTSSVDFQEVGSIKYYGLGLGYPKGWKKDPAIKTRAQRVVTAATQVLSASGFCIFSTWFGPFPLAKLIEATTGWNFSAEDYLKLGWRIQSLRLAFSLREGVNPYTVTLPGRTWGETPATKGPNKGKTLDYKELNRLYYEAMGWDSTTGIPTRDSLELVGLGSIYSDISK